MAKMKWSDWILIGVIVFVAGVILLRAAENSKPLENKDAALRVLKAQHALDESQSQMKDLQIKWSELQSQLQNLNAEAKKIHDEQPVLQKELTEAEDEAYKSAGLDRKTWQFNPGTLSFTPVAQSAPAGAAKVSQGTSPGKP